MRLQLAVAAVVLTAAASPAAADGTLSMRGVYYKERATRVMQPMLDGVFDVGRGGVVNAHFLVDAITSASASSGADNAMPFTENRVEGGAGYTHDFRLFRAGAQLRYSSESDYTSLFAGVRAEMDLAQKNATLSAGFGVASDEISAASAQGPAIPTLACSPLESARRCELSTKIGFVGASQILSRHAVIGVTYDIAKLDGYQSNPYRTALADDGIAPERHPTERLRQAIAASLRFYVPRTKTTVIGAYRYYHDSWDVDAHTPEVRIVQQVGDSADAGFRYRYHTQDGAYFYRERYPTTDAAMFPFVSDDVKLSEFTDHTFEAKLGVLGETFGMSGRWAGARFEGILTYVAQYNRFGNAVIAHAALTVPLSY
ncbi:MAG: DUF3570 domain-containing protein [Kofleriaceae bacterium]|nr:DUF3570 domain-containing protein [Kofleriaceae bacterium]